MNRAPNAVWMCREVGVYPNASVACDDDDLIKVAVEPGDGKSYGLRMSRKTARLLAKRINACLDATLDKPKRVKAK